MVAGQIYNKRIVVGGANSSYFKFKVSNIPFTEGIKMSCIIIGTNNGCMLDIVIVRWNSLYVTANKSYSGGSCNPSVHYTIDNEGAITLYIKVIDYAKMAMYQVLGTTSIVISGEGSTPTLPSNSEQILSKKACQIGTPFIINSL